MKGKECDKNSMLNNKPEEESDEWDSVFNNSSEDDSSKDNSDHANLSIKRLNL